MNITDISRKAKLTSGIKFRAKNTQVELKFEPSGHIYAVDGKRYDLHMDNLVLEYEIICDHPFKDWERMSQQETGVRKCLNCEREIILKGLDAPATIPEKISPKLTKREQEKEESLKILMKGDPLWIGALQPKSDLDKFLGNPKAAT